MLYDWNIIATSSEIFGYLRQSSAIIGTCSENVRGRSPSLRNNIGKSSEIFGKWSKIFGKLSETSLLVSLYNKQNNTRTLEIWNLSSRVHIRYLTRSISMWTLEDKFHFSARPCIILYVSFKKIVLHLSVVIFSFRDVHISFFVDYKYKH